MPNNMPSLKPSSKSFQCVKTVVSSNVTVTLCTFSCGSVECKEVAVPCSPPPVVTALKPSLFQTWSALALVIVLLLLSTRDCAKSLVSQAGTVSRVHVSSRSGGWRIDGSAGPQPKRGGRRWEGRRLEKKGGGGGETQRWKQVSRELAGSACTWGQSFI